MSHEVDSRGVLSTAPRSVDSRSSWDDYYLDIARAVSKRSNCRRRAVGAVIVKDKWIISAGYNGTPFGVPNCFDGGCLRCATEVEPGVGYDTCVCVHAEQNAIVLAARHGTATDGSRLYSTLRPCFGCLKEAIQAGITEIAFCDSVSYSEDLEDAYRSLISSARIAVRRIHR